LRTVALRHDRREPRPIGAVTAISIARAWRQLLRALRQGMLCQI
jgi:hypothetical protein